MGRIQIITETYALVVSYSARLKPSNSELRKGGEGKEMKIIDDNNYNREFPERYSWGLIDSISGSEIGYSIKTAILFDLQTAERNYTPGLRRALNIMAGYYDG